MHICFFLVNFLKQMLSPKFPDLDSLIGNYKSIDGRAKFSVGSTFLKKLAKKKTYKYVQKA